jgi:cold shock CspA family protein/ribosome-associated translation inhibitor RaiA
MQVPLEINYHHVDRSDWIDDYVKSRVAKLEQFSPDMVSCRVTIEQSQNAHRTGNPYRAHVEVSLPAKRELVAEKTDTVADPHIQLRPIIRHAFEAMEKQLKKENGIRSERGRGLAQQADETTPPEATVVRKFADEGYGFLKNLTGEEIYFHRNAVLHDDFDRLTIGTRVRYEPEEGEEGPQASSVQIIDKPGVSGSTAEGDLIDMPEGWESE